MKVLRTAEQAAVFPVGGGRFVLVVNRGEEGGRERDDFPREVQREGVGGRFAEKCHQLGAERGVGRFIGRDTQKLLDVA